MTALDAYGKADELRPLIEKVRDVRYGVDSAASKLADTAEALADEVQRETTVAERLADALRDENGLAPTSAALYVLAKVVDALNEVDARWAHRYLPGNPSVTDYAAMAREALGGIEQIAERY